MTETLINSEDDMQWLFDVHIVNNLMIDWKPRSAVIIGNEDSPDEIRLYPRRKPLVSDLPLIGKLVFDSYEFCGPLQRLEAMEIDQK